MFLSCDIFQTRDVEIPEDNRSHFYPPLIDTIVIENLKYAIKEQNVENYIRCFADSNLFGEKFIFIPTIGAQINYQNIFSNWNLNDERMYFENICESSEKDSSILSLVEMQKNIFVDSTKFFFQYEVNFKHNKNFPKFVNGGLEFVLKKNTTSGLWNIVRWTDFANQNTLIYSWSDWKANFH